MKSDLRVHPLVHRTPEWIEAHVFLCALALLLERVAEKACDETWRSIRDALRSIKVGQLLTPHGMLFQTSPVIGTSRGVFEKIKDPPSSEGAGDRAGGSGNIEIHVSAARHRRILSSNDQFWLSFVNSRVILRTAIL